MIDSKFTIDNQRMERILVTPEQAAIWLAGLHEKQRRFRRQFADGYAEDMREGNWNPNSPAPIVISETGKLLDGQHRLSAIVSTGIPLLSWVCFDCDESTYDFIDSGHTRRLSDRNIELPHKFDCLALARRMVVLERGRSLATAAWGGGTVTQQQILCCIDDRKDHILRCIRSATRVQSAVGSGTISTYSVVLHMATVIYGDDAIHKIEASLATPSQSLLTFQRRISNLFSGLVRPKGPDVVPVFLAYCDAILNGYELRSFRKMTETAKRWDDDYHKLLEPVDDESPEAV